MRWVFLVFVLRKTGIDGLEIPGNKRLRLCYGRV